MRALSLAPLAGPGLEALRAMGTIDIDPWNAHVPIRLYQPQELIDRLDGYDTLIVEADFVGREVFEHTKLRLLGVCRGEPNNVDIAAATDEGVLVVRTPGRNARAVADLTVGLMFSLLRNVVAADRDVRAGRWMVDGEIAQQRYVGREIASCRVGLIGLGAVGSEVARSMRALGVSVAAFDPGLPPDAFGDVERVRDLGELLATSDILSVHAPLTQATRGMLGEVEFSQMKRGALFVNTARFGIANEAALLRALGDGTIAAAAFDHFENEFLPTDHPLVSMGNVILTPHIGGTTIETVENHTATLARAFAEIEAGGAPPELVNPDAMARRAP